MNSWQIAAIVLSLALMPSGADRSLPPEGSPVPGILYGLGAAVVAVILAALALFPRYISESVRRTGARLGTPVLNALRSLHSGDVADYVAWIVVGISIMGLVFAFLLP